MRVSDCEEAWLEVGQGHQGEPGELVEGEEGEAGSVDRIRVGRVQYIRCGFGDDLMYILCFLCFLEPIENIHTWMKSPSSGCSLVVGIVTIRRLGGTF